MRFEQPRRVDSLDIARFSCLNGAQGSGKRRRAGDMGDSGARFTDKQERRPVTTGPIPRATVLHPRCLQIDTLGDLRVRGPLSVNSLGSRALRLLSFLLSVQGHSSTKEYIAESLWPDNMNNANNLHAAAHDLRLWLGDTAYLELRSGQYLLGGVMVDADDFESRCRAGIALERSDHRHALDELELAIVAYTGSFLPHTSDHWVTARRQQLEELFLEATAFCADDALSTSDFSLALSLASRVLSVNHLREDMIRLQMKALAGLGRRPEAISGYERFRVTLARELQCRPDPVTRALYSQIAAGITLRTINV